MGHTDLVKYHKSSGFVDIQGGGRSVIDDIGDVIIDGGTFLPERKIWDGYTFVHLPS